MICGFGELAAPARRRLQAIWSIRVPCPGGSGACAGAEALPSVSLSPSVFAGAACGALACSGWTGGGGAALEMVETLMGNILLAFRVCGPEANDL
jgi:hypothetical protein